MSRYDQIIEQAAQLFYQKGFQATSMREIAGQLDMKAASLYNHINAKEDVLAAIIMRLAHEFVNHIKQTAGQNFSPVDQLKDIIHHHIQININQSEPLAILNNQWIYLSVPEKQKFIELRTIYEDHLREIIREGIYLKQIKNTNPDIIIFSMLSSLRNLHLWYKKHQIDEKQLQKELAELLINGFLLE